MKTKKVIVKFKKVDPEVEAPKRENFLSGLWDLTVHKATYNGSEYTYTLGVIVDIPEGFTGMLYCKGGYMAAVNPGDREEISVTSKFQYAVGEVMTKLAIFPVADVFFDETHELPELRGEKEDESILGELKIS